MHVHIYVDANLNFQKGLMQIPSSSGKHPILLVLEKKRKNRHPLDAVCVLHHQQEIGSAAEAAALETSRRKLPETVTFEIGIVFAQELLDFESRPMGVCDNPDDHGTYQGNPFLGRPKQLV